jgi:hypothetical protein
MFLCYFVACEEVLLTGENGTLSFPANQSEKYPHGVDCDWRINGTLGKVNMQD